MNYIYLLQVYTEFPDKIYKLGKTRRDFPKRYDEYVKGNVEPNIIFVINCLDCNTAETELLDIFKEKFGNPKGYGREYFKGDVNDMIRTLLEYYHTNMKCIKEEKDNDIDDNIYDDEINDYDGEVNDRFSEFKKDYFNFMTINDIIKKYQISQTTYFTLLKKLGVKRDRTSKTKRMF